MLKDFKIKGYETPTVEICTMESTLICATSTSDFNNGGALPGWDAVNTNPFVNGGNLPSYD